MKTMLLFSSIFYLLGLKLGNTIEVVKRVVLPVRSVISAPATKPESAGESYYFKTTEPAAKNKTEKNNSTNVNNTPGSKVNQGIPGNHPI
jgi:hypothetical protein